MISLETTRSKLFDLLTGKNFDITTRDAQGKETTDPKSADLYSFAYKVDGKTYGNVVITVGAKGEMEVFYGDMLGKGMDAEHKGDWYDFLYQLRHFAKRNMLEFTLKNINRLKYSMQSMASLEESKNYYGFKKTSYTKPNKTAKLKIIHSKPIDEEAGDQRYRNIQSLYVENADGERFKLPFTQLYGGRAMARHVSEGGNPYDAFGEYIAELCADIRTLSAFTRYAKGKNFADTNTAKLAERGIRHFGNIKRKVKSIINKRGYHKALETFNTQDPVQNEVLDKVRNLFTENMLDTRVESALPILAKLELEGKSMKQVEQFERWANDTAVLEGEASDRAGEIAADTVRGSMFSNKDELESALSDALPDFPDKEYDRSKAVERAMEVLYDEIDDMIEKVDEAKDDDFKSGKAPGEFMIGYAMPGDTIEYFYADNFKDIQDRAQQVRDKGMKVGKMGRSQPLKDLPTVMEGPGQKMYDLMDKLKKTYEPLRGKKISPKSAEQLQQLMDKFKPDLQMLKDLYVLDIPFISQMAATRLISDHKMKADEILALREGQAHGNYAYAIVDADTHKIISIVTGSGAKQTAKDMAQDMPKATKIVPTFPAMGKKVGDTMLALGEATRDHDDQGKHNVDVIAGIGNLIADDDMDSVDYKIALDLYKKGDMAGLRDHIYDLDTVPREAIMMMIGKSDRRAFDYMYPKAKSGDYMSSISFDHGHSRNKDKDDKFLSYIEPGTVMSEDDVDEGNAFTDALRKAKEAGESEFEVDGKKYKVEEDELDVITKLAQVDEVLKPADKKVVAAFKRGDTAKGPTLSTDGKELMKGGMGAQTIATKKDGEHKIVAKMDGRHTQSVVNYINKTL